VGTPVGEDEAEHWVSSGYGKVGVIEQLTHSFRHHSAEGPLHTARVVIEQWEGEEGPCIIPEQ
jgi:hypothetical protein